MQVGLGDTFSSVISKILCLSDWEIHQLQQKFSTQPESREAINQDVLWRTPPMINEFLVKMNENNLPMWMTFVDYEEDTD